MWSWQQAEELQRTTAASEGRGVKRRRPGTALHCDYLNRKNKPANRRTIHPLITFTTILEEMLNEMRHEPDAEPFCAPVNIKVNRKYYEQDEYGHIKFLFVLTIILYFMLF